MDMYDALNRVARNTKSHKRARQAGMDEGQATLAVAHGVAIAQLTSYLDNIERAKAALRDGNPSTATMFLDMCVDPRKETQ